MPFKALGLHPSLVQGTRDLRYVEPTPVQAEAIPAVLAGRDLIAATQTGTGKTAPDLQRIIARLPARRQTLLFSATIPPVIARLAQEILRDPVTVQIGRRRAPAVGITQAAYPVGEHLKPALLRHLLRHTEMPSVLVFTRTRRSAGRLARVIAADGFAVCELHSD